MRLPRSEARALSGSTALTRAVQKVALDGGRRCRHHCAAVTWTAPDSSRCPKARAQGLAESRLFRGVAVQERRLARPPRVPAARPRHFVIAADPFRGKLARMPPDDPVRILDIADPCPAVWREMSGTGAARHCGECKKDVHSLSAMDHAAAADLLAGAAPGGICVRVRCDSEGFILHDAPTEQRSAPRRLRLLSPAVFAAMAACSAPADGDSSLVVEGPGFTASTVQSENSADRGVAAHPGAPVRPSAPTPSSELRPPVHENKSTPEQGLGPRLPELGARHVMGMTVAPVERADAPHGTAGTAHVAASNDNSPAVGE